MAKIYAPFTDEQVEALRQWQLGYLDVKQEDGSSIAVPTHPFTCGGAHCDRSKRDDEGVLLPNKDGWICPCGEYKQDWCHDFMIDNDKITTTGQK